MKGFIEVTESNSTKRLINPLRCQFHNYHDGKCGFYLDGVHYQLVETYDEVKELIRKSQDDKTPEMLEMLKEFVELRQHGFRIDELQERARQLLKSATEL